MNLICISHFEFKFVFYFQSVINLWFDKRHVFYLFYYVEDLTSALSFPFNCHSGLLRGQWLTEFIHWRVTLRRPVTYFRATSSSTWPQSLTEQPMINLSNLRLHAEISTVICLVKEPLWLLFHKAAPPLFLAGGRKWDVLHHFLSVTKFS